MPFEDGDILINDKFNCRYGVLLDIVAITLYMPIYKVMTENGVFTWDDADIQLLRRPRPKSMFKSKTGDFYEFKFFDIPNMAVCLFSLKNRQRTMGPILDFLRDFQMEHADDLPNSQTAISCMHDYKPWPFDIYKSYCKHCGIEK